MNPVLPPILLIFSPYDLIPFRLLMNPADIRRLDILHVSIFLRHAQP
jgi:hypothetical protein